jgi:hypothetical protein
MNKNEPAQQTYIMKTGSDRLKYNLDLNDPSRNEADGFGSRFPPVEKTAQSTVLLFPDQRHSEPPEAVIECALWLAIYFGIGMS